MEWFIHSFFKESIFVGMVVNPRITINMLNVQESQNNIAALTLSMGLSSFQIEICNLDRTKSSFIASSLYKTKVFITPPTMATMIKHLI